MSPAVTCFFIYANKVRPHFPAPTRQHPGVRAQARHSGHPGAGRGTRCQPSIQHLAANQSISQSYKHDASGMFNDSNILFKI